MIYKQADLKGHSLPNLLAIFCSLTIISMATEINTQTAPNTFEAWLESCSHIFPLLSLQDASHAHHKLRASNRSFMQMCKVFKLTTAVSNQAPRRRYWLNIWSIYRALGQACWAMRIWHWPKNYSQLGLDSTVWSHDEKCLVTQKQTTTTSKKDSSSLHGIGNYVGARWKFTLPVSCLYKSNAPS